MNQKIIINLNNTNQIISNNSMTRNENNEKQNIIMSLKMKILVYKLYLKQIHKIIK